MTDVMIDIETLGRDPGAAIASVGAVRFDHDDGVDEEFFESVSLADCQQNGLEIDAETVTWWLNQPATAREQLHGGQKLAWVLGKLKQFVDDAERVWGNSPAFDMVILREAYRAVDRECPWEYWDERDYRTVREMARGRGEWPDRDQQTTEHDGLDDARFQAEQLVRYWGDDDD